MNTRWFKHLPVEEQSTRRELVKEYSKAWEILTEVLQRRLEGYPVYPDYTNPSWAYEQAHSNGRYQAIREVIELLKEEES